MSEQKTKSMRDVICVRCAQKGHRCQAQMRAEEGGLCLRCADGEPCCYETAAAVELAAWRGEAVDLFVPVFRTTRPEAPAEPVRRAERCARVRIHAAERNEIYLELYQQHSLASIAFSHGITEAEVQAIRNERTTLRKAAVQRATAQGVGREAPAPRRVELRLHGTVPCTAPARPRPKANPAAGWDAIECAVEAFFGLEPKALRSKSQAWKIVVPRQISFRLAAELLSMGSSEIGRHAALHHTTVIYARQKMEKRIKVDTGLAATVEALRAQITKGWKMEWDGAERAEEAAEA